MLAGLQQQIVYAHLSAINTEVWDSDTYHKNHITWQLQLILEKQE